jgi:predicted DCC family thiol-disulfide oxidoreductase YuxK
MSNGWTGGQYSLLRVMLGAYLLVGVGLLAGPATAPGFDSAGRIPLFPNPLDLLGPPMGGIALIALGAAAGLLLLVGLFERIGAVALLYILACLVDARLLVLDRGLAGVGLLLAAQPFVPAGPYGSLAARGRIDPRGDWRLPGPVLLAVWDVTALGLVYVGCAGILGADWFGGPESIERFGEWIDLALGVGCLSLVWVPRSRPWLWGALSGWHLWLLAADPGWSTAGTLVMMVFLFDPGWVRPIPAAASETIFFDGSCGLCHRTVRFVLAEDRGESPFRFAPLEGERFRDAVASDRRSSLPDSLVTLTANGALLTRSTGVLHISKRLGGLWRAFAVLFTLLPRPLRDLAYDLVAAVRHRLFLRPLGTCPRIPPDLLARFDE